MGVDNLSGRVLGGRYELQEVLGVGGMGTVYSAHQTDLNRSVAVKILPPALAMNTDFMTRFQREAQTAAALEHPHIISIFDFGSEDNLTYVVMPVLTGGTLNQVRKEGGFRDLNDIADLLTKLGSALDYAHQFGVVHRDIKPDNIMFSSHGAPFILDFGIAKLLSSDATVITQGGMSVGTPAYMSPEQWRGEEMSAATDQYAMAVVVYELLTDQLPFSVTTPQAMMYKHLHEDPTPPNLVREEIPESISQVLLKALAKDPNARFASVSAFAAAFELSIKQRSVSSFIDVGNVPTPPPSSAAQSKPFYTSPLAWGGLIGLIVIVGLLAFLVVTSQSDGDDDDATATATQAIARDVTDTPTNRPPPTETNTAIPSDTPEDEITVTTEVPTEQTPTSDNAVIDITPTEEISETPTETNTPEDQIVTETSEPTIDETSTIESQQADQDATNTNEPPTETETDEPTEPTVTNTATDDPTPTNPPTDEPTATDTPTATEEPTATNTPTATSTNTPSSTPTSTITPSPTITASPTITPTEEPLYLCLINNVTGNNINIRNRPSTQGSIITTLPPSDNIGVLLVSEDTNDPNITWYQVVLNDGGTGWVSSTTVTEASPCPQPGEATPNPTIVASVNNAYEPVERNADWEPVIQLFDIVEMVLVPAGCFDMGSFDGNSDELPVTEICFDEPFWIDRYEVTNEQFNFFGGQSSRGSTWTDNNLPREHVNWDEANAFCELRGGSLPTEAQWEYAARGPDNLVYPWGNDFNPDNAVFLGNSSNRTAEIGSKPDGVSWVGAFDMSGNVREWVSSLYHPYPYDAEDGRESSNAGFSNRITRGGGWQDGGGDVRATTRISSAERLAGNVIGFRCVLPVRN